MRNRYQAPAQLQRQSMGRNPLPRRLRRPPNLGITSDENATFIECEALAGSKAEEADVADGTCTMTLPLRAKRLRGILNDEGTFMPRDRADGFEIGNPSAQMGGNDGESLAIAKTRELFGIVIKGSRRNVAYDGNQSAMKNGQCNQRTGISGDDHLAPRACVREGRQG